MGAADLYCQPNVAPDAFGLAFVEALRAGLPVVTTPLGGAPEVVDASCGVMVPVGDAARLREALLDLISSSDRRTSLGRAGPSRAASLCDPARQVERLDAALMGAWA